jgi:hypothetical protein
MTVKERQKLERVVTPAGVARWPALSKPKNKYQSEELEYVVDVIIGSAESKSLRHKLDDATDEAFQSFKAKYAGKKDKKGKPIKVEKADSPYGLVFDDEGNETGDYFFKIRCNAQGKTKNGEVFNFKPALFDAKGKPLSKSVNIGGGTTLKASFEIVPYYVGSSGKAGVSLRLKAVQVLDLVQFGGGGNAKSFGFDEEEGYEFEGSEDDEDEEVFQDAETNDDDEDF